RCEAVIVPLMLIPSGGWTVRFESAVVPSSSVGPVIRVPTKLKRRTTSGSSGKGSVLVVPEIVFGVIALAGPDTLVLTNTASQAVLTAARLSVSTLMRLTAVGAWPAHEASTWVGVAAPDSIRTSVITVGALVSSTAPGAVIGDEVRSMVVRALPRPLMTTARVI